jgi:hypothetical protein
VVGALVVTCVLLVLRSFCDLRRTPRCRSRLLRALLPDAVPHDQHVRRVIRAGPQHLALLATSAATGLRFSG